MPRVFLIDTDTASDDAVALIMALRAPGVQVAAITTVAGNVNVEQATRNALYTAELCGSDVPVYTGAAKPLLRVHEDAAWFHGRDGLGDHGFAPARRAPEKMHAVDAIIETIEAYPGLVTVTLGPLTNLALALARKPEIASRVSRCVVMGGAPCCEGNVTPAAEYNIWVDPEAARMVLRGGLPVELVGWQLSRGDAVLNAGDIDCASSLSTERARFAIACNSRARAAYLEQTGEHGIALPDPVAMAVAIYPHVCTSASEHYVDVETDSELTRGMTVVDRLNVAGNHRNRAIWSELLAKRPNARVCWSIDVKQWKDAVFRFAVSLFEVLSEFFELPAYFCELGLQPAHALIERRAVLHRRGRLRMRDNFTRQQVCEPRFLLPGLPRESLGQRGRAFHQPVESGLHFRQIFKRVQTLRAAAQLAHGLRPAKHQHTQNGLFAAIEVEDLAHPVPEFGDAMIAAARAQDQAFRPQALHRGQHRLLIKRHHRFPVRLLIACCTKCVQ